jgi:hypothetical protein
MLSTHPDNTSDESNVVVIIGKATATEVPLIADNSKAMLATA